MTTSTILRHLISIRDGFKKVDAITRGLGARPQQSELEAALIKRGIIVNDEIDGKARELTVAYPDWRTRARGDGALRSIIEEAEGFMHSILRMDECLAMAVGQRMDEVKSKLGSLRQTSRMAYSYTTQSTLRARH